jgi:hypothetical protein
VVFPLCVFILWIAERFWPEDADVLHALLHVTSVIGVHCYVY